ncbi:MAG: OPT/YSL family transporter, partial [Bacteroidales bacterium]|nr:OPT/YSL family transporter [Bacteroidales bacterium]
ASVLIIALDNWLQAKNYPFRTPVLAIAIGFYLPFQLSVPIFAGGIISLLIKKYHKRRANEEAEVEASDRRGLLMASGLITGEALMGILVAIPIVILKQYDINMPLWAGKIPFGDIAGVLLLIFVALWFYRVTVKRVVN